MRLVYERRSSDWSVADQFRLVYPFSSWMTKYAISFVAISEEDSVTITTLAHTFAVVVTLAIALPAIDLPLFASIRLKSIFEADRILRKKPAVLCSVCNRFHHHDELIAFPLNAVHVYNELWGRTEIVA